MNLSTTARAKFACAFAGAAWGLFWIPLRWLDAAGIEGAWATVSFYLVPFVLALPWLPGHLRRLPAGGVALQWNAFWCALALVLYACALLETEVVRAILLFYLTPVWSTLIGRAVLGEPITVRRWTAIALGFAGMLTILGVDQGVPWPRNVGDWMGLASGLAWSIASVRLRLRPSGATRDLFIAYLGWGTLMAFAALAVPGLDAAAPTAPAMAAAAPWAVPVILLLIVPTTYAVLWGTPLLSPAVVGLLFMTEVSVGAASAAVLAGEPFGAREIAGVALITAAGLLESLPPRRRGTAR